MKDIIRRYEASNPPSNQPPQDKCLFRADNGHCTHDCYVPICRQGSIGCILPAPKDNENAS